MKPLRSFNDTTHFYGRIWGLVSAVLILCFPFIVMAIFGASIDWSIVVAGIGIVGLYWVVGAVETFTYTPMLGVGGTYLGFVTGNLSNLKVPCALHCMEQAKTETGTDEAEVVSTIAIAVSSIVTMLIIVIGVIFITLLTPILQNETLRPAFDQVLPALFGGMAVVYISKDWKIAVLPCALMLIVFITASLISGGSSLASTLIGVMVPIGVIVTLLSTRFMYNRGWLGERTVIAEDTDEKDPADSATTQEKVGESSDCANTEENNQSEPTVPPSDKE